MKKTIRLLAAKLLVAGLIIVQVLPAFAAEEYEITAAETVCEEACQEAVTEELTENEVAFEEAESESEDVATFEASMEETENDILGETPDHYISPVIWTELSGAGNVGEMFYDDGIWYATTSDSTATVIGIDNDISQSTTSVAIKANVATAGNTYEVTEVGEAAFANSQNIEEIFIPDTIKKINKGAFAGLYSLKEAVIPDSVTFVGVEAFAGCENMATVSIGKKVKYIGDRAFYLCKKLKKAEIPDSVKDLGPMCFLSCYELETVVFGKGIDTIPIDGFQSCTSLKDLIIPNWIKEIGSGAFCFCNSLTEVVIPEGISEIGSNTFFYCLNLKKVTIPSTVQFIDDAAFSQCNYLNNIICYAKNPPATTEKTFVKTSGITVTVPYGSKASYEKDARWGTIKDVTFVEMEKPYNPSHGGGSSASSEKPVSTGTWGAPVSDGTWTINPATGLWSYKTNAVFKNTWGFIVNPYAGYIPQWYYFDAAGNSLVGWQWIMGADGKYHCYYLNPFHNGSYGACLLNTITPDGYTVNANGEWTVNGVVQSK